MQQELLSVQDLTAAVALQKATAAEAVSNETQAMQETTTATGGEVYKLLSKTKCYRCGKSGHHPSNCKFKSAKCYSCQKVGHLASVCQSKKPTITSERPQAATKAQGKPPTKATQVHHTSEDTMATEIMTEVADVFKDELGLLKGIQANVTVDEPASPRFHKPRPVPFALKEKVEQ